jgi:diaminohydroxyphosphoribosylaminopyrimidine deaminase/5-amino-6-(5-phosphoribosylamino)uracil reductase
MQRALELAQLGQGYVAPNPMVGCVIVHQNRIIGEGWHEQYGGPHAEVNAIHQVKDKKLLTASTAYVTLEPCAHHGKTPPCCDLLIAHQLKRVVVACEDPFEAVSGKGITRMRAAGIQVDIGLLEKEAQFLNRRFFTGIKYRRPYIILKWAQTADGFIARENGDSKWISNKLSRSLVHRYRHEEAAILVGAGTLATDNPALTTRMYPGRDPIRIVIENHRQLSQGYTVFQDDKTTLLYSAIRQNAPNIQHFKGDDDNWLEYILTNLYERNIQSVLVEGGAQTLQEFLNKGLWDEIRCFVAPIHFGAGLAAPTWPSPLTGSSQFIGQDKLVTVFNPVYS